MRTIVANKTLVQINSMLSYLSVVIELFVFMVFPHSSICNHTKCNFSMSISKYTCKHRYS